MKQAALCRARLQALVIGAGLALAACGGGTGSATGTVSAFISALQSKDYSQACSYVDSPPSDCTAYVAQQFSEQSQHSAGTDLLGVKLTPKLVDLRNGSVAEVGFEGYPNYTVDLAKTNGRWKLDPQAVGL